jgi:hypothetical protein
MQAASTAFWLTSGAEEIDSIIDPIAVEVARKRGWTWGQSLAKPAGSSAADARAHRHMGAGDPELQAPVTLSEPGGPPPP